MAVAVGVPVGVAVSVAVAVGVTVGVAVSVAVAVGVMVGIAVDVAVAVCVGVAVAVAVAVAVVVAVAVGVDVSVGIGGGVSVGGGSPPPDFMVKTPPSVPAYSIDVFSGSIAKADTSVPGRPLLIGFHIAPLLVLLKTPPPQVPA